MSGEDPLRKSGERWRGERVCFAFVLEVFFLMLLLKSPRTLHFFEALEWAVFLFDFSPRFFHDFLIFVEGRVGGGVRINFLG